MANTKSKGFTLIELIIVIAILGILAGIAIPRFLDAQAAARGSRIVADLRTIDSAATIYYAKNGKYPDAITTATPATTDGFIGANLAAWPTPNIGTFIVMQVTGSEKTFKDVTAANYTLTSEERAQYDGHTVEYYLGMSSESNPLVSALKERLNTSQSALLAAAKNTRGSLQSENAVTSSYDNAVEKELANLNIGANNASWALKYNSATNTVSLYVTDHKLTYKGDHGKTVNVQIYTGTVVNKQVTSWSGPVSGTVKVISVPGKVIYPKLDV